MFRPCEIHGELEDDPPHSSDPVRPQCNGGPYQDLSAVTGLIRVRLDSAVAPLLRIRSLLWSWQMGESEISGSGFPERISCETTVIWHHT